MWFLCAQVDHIDASLERNAFFVCLFLTHWITSLAQSILKAMDQQPDEEI